VTKLQEAMQANKNPRKKETVSRTKVKGDGEKGDSSLPKEVKYGEQQRMKNGADLNPN
jgi:hypothetical protein